MTARVPLIAAWKRNRQWLWTDILGPLAVTRLALLLVAWFSGYLPPNASYPVTRAIDRGWHFSPYRLLDVWGRWDTGWYMKIVSDGYHARGDLSSVQSNLAFFPLYPYLVKLLALPIPDSLVTPGVYLAVGAVLSTVLLLGALVLLRMLVMGLSGDPGAARRSVLYTLVFPTAFFFSCFYTESLFLFLSVAAFFFAFRRKWAWAGLSGMLLSATRPLGILIVIPLLCIYLEGRGGKLRSLDRGIVYVLAVPLGLLLFMVWSWYAAGDFFAPLLAQGAWNRGFALPWQTFSNPGWSTSYIVPFEQILTIGFLVLSAAALFLLPSSSLGLYALLSMLPVLFSGSLQSSVRYWGMLFPAFMVLAKLSEERLAEQTICGAFLTVQVLFMAAWSQFYWVA